MTKTNKNMKGKIFNEFEVQTIIAGMKTMFREVIKNAIYDQPVHSYKDWLGDGWYYPIATLVLFDKNNKKKEKETRYTSKAVKPKFEVGQEIFVKEPFNIFCGQVSYKTTITGNERYFWMPASRMKQEQARLILRIKSVKVERLQDINEKEAFKSGYFTIPNREAGESYISKFKQLWDSTQKKQEHKWEANQWVFVYEFEIINLKK